MPGSWKQIKKAQLQLLLAELCELKEAGSLEDVEEVAQFHGSRDDDLSLERWALQAREVF